MFKIAAVVVTGLLIQDASAQRVRIQPPSYKPEPPRPSAPRTLNVPPTADLLQQFDVAGVKLGMESEKVVALLASKGFHVPREEGGEMWSRRRCDWNCRIEKIAAQRQLRAPKPETKGLEYIDSVGPNEQRIVVTFVPSPTGMIVSEVTYGIPTTQISEPDFISKAVQKYGKNYSRYSDSILFCHASLPCARDIEDKVLTPYISDSSSKLGGYTNTRYYQFTLYEGAQMARRRAALFSATVERVAPKSGQVAF